jgi:acetyl-CoA carboxylase carboxyl transferase subunit beta
MIGKLFKKNKTIEIKSIKTTSRYNDISAEMYDKCKFCGEIIFKEDLINNLRICPNCNGYHRLNPRERIDMLMDENSFEELFEFIESSNPIDFEGYQEKIERYQKQCNEKTAILTGIGMINGMKTAIACMNPYFMMGSMGSALGEKLTRLIEYATDNHLPVVIFTASGGARMQEGVFSLMQMAKISGALKKHSNEGNLYITVLTDPTTGGVSASFAMLGDIILAEPNALIGFAGPRVIKQTIKSELPEGFQRSEYLLEHGFVDQIVKRKYMKSFISRILRIHQVGYNEK